MNGRWSFPSSLPRYWTPISDDSGRPMSRQRRVRRSVRPLQLHLPEEVVRGEEGEVAAEVAEVPHQVVLVARHVLGVAREDDEVVVGDQLLGGPDRLEVRLGQDVGLLAGLAQPAEEVDVVLAPLRRHAAPDEHPPESGGALGALRVPRVAPAVPVGVAEVVGLPRVRRHHDRDAAPLAEGRRADHERRVADPAVVRGQLDEVDPGRPGAEGTVQRRPAVTRLPLDRHRLVDGDAVHQRVAVRARVLAARPERLQRQRVGVGLDREPGRARGDVALGREAGVDAEHADDRRAELAALARVVGAVRAPVAGAVEGAEADQIRARPDRPVREPRERVPARLQVRPQLVDRRRRAERPRHLEVHLGGLVQVEADLGRLAQPVAVGRDRRHALVVALEGQPARGCARGCSSAPAPSGRRGAARSRGRGSRRRGGSCRRRPRRARRCAGGRSSGSRGSGGAPASTIQPSTRPSRRAS